MKCVYCGRDEKEVNIKEVAYGLKASYNNICQDCFNQRENKREED